jgi:hypothetical protein
VLWFLVLGSWFLVLGSWFLVLGSWFLVLGFAGPGGFARGFFAPLPRRHFAA